MAALLTRTSSRPKRRSTSVAVQAAASGTATSSAMASTVPPSFLAAASPLARSRTPISTVKPSSASWRPVSSPMPRLPPVMSAKLVQHLLRFRLGVDRRLQVGRDCHLLRPAIGAVPAAVGLRRLDLAQAMLRHAARLHQAGDIVDVDPAPDALPAARRVALQ